MSVSLLGNYYLRLTFGGEIVPTDPRSMEMFIIVQDMNKFLPSFRIKLADTGGILTHVSPFDSKMSEVSVEVGPNINKAPENSFDFTVFRRFPLNQFASATTYDIDGLLTTATPLLAPDYCRSWKDKTVKQILETIAKDELGVDVTDISSSLNYIKMIVQPHWSNAQLLNDLMKRLIGSNNESCFKCFIYRYNRKTYFAFKSIGELVDVGKPKLKFVIDDEPFEDYIPVYDYSIFDNYKALGILGAKRQEYHYFDYYGDVFVNSGIETCQDLLSLTDYFMIDGNDTEYSDTIIEYGRNNDFTRDYKGNTRAIFHNRLMNLVKMWILTWGKHEVVPGDVVQVFFPQGVLTGDLYSYQYSGFWLVERVIHVFGDTHKTKLLLTRNGYDTDMDTTSIKATKKIKLSATPMGV